MSSPAKSAAQPPIIQTELFVPTVAEWPVKDDLGSMEFPIFSLTKKKDASIRDYHNAQTGKRVRIMPSVLGAATMFDKDLLLFIGSQIMEARRQGLAISRQVKIDVYQFLTGTSKSTGGKAYELILDMLRRLKGTTIETNIKTGQVEQTHGFGIIEDYKVDRYTKNGKGVLDATVTISEWLYNALIHYEVLTLDREYFQLGQALERRLYELARKHAGEKPLWKCDIDLLRTKTGTTQDLRRFRSELRSIIERDSIPKYAMALDTQPKQHKVVFYTRNTKALLAELSRTDNFDWFEKLERSPSS